MLTIKDAARLYSQSERTIRRRISEGALPAYRIGPTAIRVRREDVEALARPIPTVSSMGRDLHAG